MLKLFYIVQIPFIYVLPGNIEYSIRQSSSNRKSHTQYGMVSLGIPNLILPIIILIHICLSPINRISTSQRNGNYPIDDKCEIKKKKIKKRDCRWEWNYSYFIQKKSFTKNREQSWYIFFIGSVGTDGARTRSFRLDRAVLWPIELQSQVNTIIK